MYEKYDKSFLIVKSKIDATWLAEDLSSLLTIINELYNITLAYDITINEFYRTIDEFIYKLEPKIYKQILKKVDFIEVFEDAAKHIRLYVSNNEMLYIDKLSISSELHVNFQGIGKILKIVKEILYRRDYERVNDMLRLRTQYPNDPTVMYYSETLLFKMKRKYLKQVNKFRKLQEKYKIVVED